MTKREEQVMVIGGGITGIQASLDLAASGVQVHLVEMTPSIGGRMAQLDKTFPTNDCSICILAPKMIECFNHKRINVMTYSQVQSIKGKAGDFTVSVLRRPRFVDEDKCTGCGACMEKCPKKVPSEFDMGLRMRKAIYIPFAQAVPRIATIDEEHCIFFERGKCRVCEKVCQAKAINFEMKPRVEKVRVKAVIIATGFDVFMPEEIEEYGYGTYPNVVTSMEFERIINAAGPTGGHLQRMSDDHERPKRLAFIQCVGSRDVRFDQAYCCAVCCMYTTKEAILAREHYPDTQSYIFYTDLRAFGKGFNEYVERAKKDYAVTYIRAKPGEIQEDPESKNLMVYYRDPDTYQIKAMEVDMVVLATTLVPRKDARGLADTLGVELDEHGFFKTPQAEVAPMDTSTPGILTAGYCQKPMDIPEAVAQGSAAAARAMKTTKARKKGGAPT